MNESFVPASSYLAKVDYDSVMHKMTVTFKNGSQTMYQYVFPPTFEAFKLAPSHGKHFATQIKGKLLSLALVKHNVGQAKSTPLHKHKLERGLNNGQRISGHSRKGLEHGLTASSEQQVSSQAVSDTKAERESVKALLAEARATREMLIAFEHAVQTGTFNGNKMLDLAKGLSFIVAIIKQNSAHIDNLQERLK